MVDKKIAKKDLYILKGFKVERDNNVNGKDLQELIEVLEGDYIKEYNAEESGNKFFTNIPSMVTLYLMNFEGMYGVAGFSDDDVVGVGILLDKLEEYLEWKVNEEETSEEYEDDEWDDDVEDEMPIEEEFEEEEDWEDEDDNFISNLSHLTGAPLIISNFNRDDIEEELVENILAKVLEKLKENKEKRS